MHGCTFDVGGRSSDLRGSGVQTYTNGFRVGCALVGSVTGDALTGSITVTLNGATGLGGSSSFPLTLAKQ